MNIILQQINVTQKENNNIDLPMIIYRSENIKVITSNGTRKIL